MPPPRRRSPSCCASWPTLPVRTGSRRTTSRSSRYGGLNEVQGTYGIVRVDRRATRALRQRLTGSKRRPPTMQLQGSTFLVTGGGSGLGAACVRTFTQAGANVIIADMNAETGEATAKAAGERAKFVLTDV